MFDTAVVSDSVSDTAVSDVAASAAISDSGRPTDRPWTSVPDYQRALAALVAPLPCERVPLEEAYGRTLAAAVSARTAVPAFDASAMDGYAVRWADLAPAGPTTLQVVADLPAGNDLNPSLSPGECARIMTGAITPDSADTVVPVELTDAGTGAVVIRERPVRGQGAHIRRTGEDTATGDLVAAAGSLLTPGLLATLAATGIAEIEVARRPQIAVAATGSELRAPADELRRGQIHESNAHFVAPALAELGADVTSYGRVADDKHELIALLDQMTAAADLVVLTGGAGAGAHDVPGQVLAHADRSGFVRVRMQPGKPQGWAVWNDTPVLLLPGNPVAAAVSVVVFVQPLVCRLLGLPEPAPWTALASETMSAAADRIQFVPSRLSPGSDGKLYVAQSHSRGRGSHLVSSLVDADVLAVVPDGVDTVPAGEVVTVLPVRRLRPTTPQEPR